MDPREAVDADAVVIGAGAAGMAAAARLAGCGLRVVMLEARERDGGRVYSVPVGRCAVPAELGAEFIHGSAAETMRLLREAGSAAIDTAGEAWVCANGHLRRDDSDFVAAASIFERALRLVPDESVDTFLARFAADPGLREAVDAARSFAEGFDAADPAIASARAIADEWHSGVDFASARPLGGYPQVFHRLRRACEAAGVRVSLSTVVRRIGWRRGAVTVEARTPAGEALTVRARAAIVTLPAAVLRHRGDAAEVAFQPELPAAKRAALARVETGDVVKVVLSFRTPFWERIAGGRYRDAAFFRGAGVPFATYWTQYPVRSEQIVAWIGGPKATALRGASPNEMVQRALDALGVLFGEPDAVRAEFENGLVHDWAADPYARGAYSYLAVGADDARAVLAAPVDDTLFFAGEATASDGQGGTVNGALTTGERAAREAATALGAGIAVDA